MNGGVHLFFRITRSRLSSAYDLSASALCGRRRPRQFPTIKYRLDAAVGSRLPAVGLVGIDIHENPARGPVNRDEQVTAFSFVGHLRQVLDIRVKAGLIVLERLLVTGLSASRAASSSRLETPWRRGSAPGQHVKRLD